MFNPFKYQYKAQVLSIDTEEVLLRLERGSKQANMKFPSQLFPKEISETQSFTISLQAEAAAQKTEEESLKKLLAELIR